MATAHLICGYIGVGKTTLAEKLENSENAVRFTQDEWMSKIFGNYPDEATFTENYEKINSLMNTIWPKFLARGVDVILDLNYWTRTSRDEARNVVAALHAKAILYFVNCPLPLAWSRIEKRNLALHDGVFVSQKIFDTSLHKLEPLQPDEEHIDIKT
jgi:predicted kinase